MFDATKGLDPEETAWLQDTRENNEALSILLIANKRDLLSRPAPAVAFDGPTISLSARNAATDTRELDALIQALRERVTTTLHLADASPVVMNQRHQHHLQKALQAVRAARSAMAAQASGDALSIDLRLALHELGQITGEITNEDVLDQIFSRFCIGK